MSISNNLFSQSNSIQSSSSEMENLQLPTNFTLKCERRIYEKLMGWTMACPVEAGGLMAVKHLGECTFEIVDAYLDKQIANPTYLEIETKAIHARHFEVTKAWGDAECARRELIMEGDLDKVLEMEKEVQKKKNNMKLLRGEWHSHVNMAVYLSATDIATALRLCKKEPYVIMLVLNKSKQSYVEAYIRSPFPSKVSGKLEIYSEEVPIITDITFTPEQTSTLSAIEKHYGVEIRNAFENLVLEEKQESIEHAKFEEEQLQYEEIRRQCAIDVKEKVFSSIEYEIDELTHEIVKRKTDLQTWGNNYDFSDTDNRITDITSYGFKRTKSHWEEIVEKRNENLSKKNDNTGIFQQSLLNKIIGR